MSPLNVLLWIMPILAPNEAEQLLHQMEAKIAAAQSLRIDFTIDMGKSGRILEGSLFLAGGNRFRQEVKSASGQSSLATSDGKRVVARPEIGKPEAPFPTATPPAWYNEVLQSWLGRGGTVLSLITLQDYIGKHPGARPAAKDQPVTTNARFLSDAMVNDVKARVVEYDMAWSLTTPDWRRAKVTVWIDPETRLPLRRTMVFTVKPGGDLFTATHTRFEVDPKLEDRLFEPPGK